MDADRRRYRFRVGAFLAWAPMLALVVALAWWVLSLRSQVETLEQQIGALESRRPIVVRASGSEAEKTEVGVPYAVERAMLLDGFGPGPEGTMGLRR